MYQGWVGWGGWGVSEAIMAVGGWVALGCPGPPSPVICMARHPVLAQVGGVVGTRMRSFGVGGWVVAPMEGILRWHLGKRTQPRAGYGPRAYARTTYPRPNGDASREIDLN